MQTIIMRDIKHNLSSIEEFNKKTECKLKNKKKLFTTLEALSPKTNPSKVTFN